MDNNRVNEIETELKELSTRRKALLSELRTLRGNRNVEKIYGAPLERADISTANGRIDLFLRLFRCRKDIYPRFWENKAGKKGYSPVCTNEWISGICEKPKIKCSNCNYPAFSEFNESVAKAHLQGQDTIGTYAITPNNKCVFLVADFDKKEWEKDSLAYKESASSIGIEVALERSKSGNGAHAWIFFDSEVSAHSARQLGSLIVVLASLNRSNISLASFDRFFPNQDVIPKGGFGNLVALPLQRMARNNQNSVFVDKKFNMIEDQWGYLAKLGRLSANDIDFILARNLPQTLAIEKESDDFELASAESVIDVVVRKTREEDFEGIINVELRDQLYIDVTNLPTKVFSSLKRSATFANPEFFKLQKMRFSTWKTPRYIFSGDMNGDCLVLPRGNLDFCQKLADEVGAEVIVQDLRPKFKRKKIKFIGNLREDQKKAVKTISKTDFGVLVAPPGIGKTVIGCQMICKRKVSTLILVHRKPLMDQWIEQISNFTDIDPKKIGSFGGTKKKPKGLVDVAMLQTLSKLDDSEEFLSQYGQIIIDECHHIPATSFEEVLKKIPAKYFLGLTATPVRKDGLQAILYMQCGPIRYEMEEFGTKDLVKEVIIKETPFILEQGISEQLPIHEIWSQLIRCPKRLEMIAADVESCIEEGKYPLIVSDRKEQLALLNEFISVKKPSATGLILTGDMSKSKRKDVFEKINIYVNENKPFYILSTASLIGEGIDIPMLDSLILAMPISFRGRLKQYAGRLHRPFEGKKKVKIYDYLDPNMGLTVSMFKKRLLAYKEMGYKIESTVGSKVNHLLYQQDLFSEFTSPSTV